MHICNVIVWYTDLYIPRELLLCDYMAHATPYCYVRELPLGPCSRLTVQCELLHGLSSNHCGSVYDCTLKRVFPLTFKSGFTGKTTRAGILMRTEIQAKLWETESANFVSQLKDRGVFFGWTYEVRRGAILTYLEVVFFRRSFLIFTRLDFIKKKA